MRLYQLGFLLCTSVLGACSNSSASKMQGSSASASATLSPAGMSLRDFVKCTYQTSPDKLLAGECTNPTSTLGAYPYAVLVSPSGQYSLGNHNDQGADTGCWDVESPDTHETRSVFTGLYSKQFVYNTQTNQYETVDIPQYVDKVYNVPQTRCAVQHKSNTYDPNTSFIQMQADGNAVFYSSIGQIDTANPGAMLYGASHTEGHPGSYMQMLDSGLVVIKTAGASGKPGDSDPTIWSR